MDPVLEVLQALMYAVRIAQGTLELIEALRRRRENKHHRITWGEEKSPEETGLSIH